MDDIQDGKKISIQDGIQDVIIPELRGKSGLGLIYLLTTISNPQLTSIHTETILPERICTLTTVLQLAIT